MNGHCMACGYTGPAESFRVERLESGGDWEHCPRCRSNDVREDTPERAPQEGRTAEIET